MSGKPVPIEERFWKHVRVASESECWPWTGFKAPYGHGRVSVNRKMDNAHRVSWRLAFGEIPDGKHVLHNCHNPSCVNPGHLRLGTHRENMDDRNALGRWNSPMAKRTECKNGHAFVDGSFRQYRNARICRTCKRDVARERYRKANPGLRIRGPYNVLAKFAANEPR